MTQEYKAFFKRVGGTEGSLCHYPVRLDTYGCGCAHNCDYCYARGLLEFRGLWNPDDPRVADIGKIARRISRLERGSVVRLGGMTDCLQPAEATHHVTEQTIRLLQEANIHYLLVTKSHIVASRRLMNAMSAKPHLAHIQITVTATDDDRALSYERCSLSSKRLGALGLLQSEGFDVALRLSPYVPRLIDPERVLSHVEPKKILVEFLRIRGHSGDWVGTDDDLSLYTLKSGGYRQLPLEEKQRRIEMLRTAFPNAQLSVCEDVPEHYEYWQSSFNHNPHDCCNLSLSEEG